jgi:3'-phosphoadenosine 5'-phosphosulfate sulfotransferase (PAPS reductase)/FAD synthetase
MYERQEDAEVAGMSLDLATYARRGTVAPAAFPPPPESNDLFASPNDAMPDPMDLVRAGAMVIHNNSGGKDSQAQLIHLVERLDVPVAQIVSIHADLGESEWPGTMEHARSIAEIYGIPFHVAKAQNKNGDEKALLDYVDGRGQFMDKANRFCTSDWKRGPIRRTINALRRETAWPSPYVLNAMGMRSQESIERAKLEPVEFVKDASCPSSCGWPEVIEAPTRAARRIHFDWHPILHYDEEQVFATIEAAGQTPHWAYAAGARRLSCLVCIFSSESDMRVAVSSSDKGKAYARRIIDIEERHDHTIMPLRSIAGKKTKRFLKDVVGDILDAA